MPHGITSLDHLDATWQPMLEPPMFPSQLYEQSTWNIGVFPHHLYVHSMCHCMDMTHVFLPLWLLTLTWSLTSHKFCIRASFNEPFALLERWHWALCNDAIFETIWDGQILIIYGPLGTFVNILDPHGPFWVFWILLDQLEISNWSCALLLILEDLVEDFEIFKSYSYLILIYGLS